MPPRNQIDAGDRGSGTVLILCLVILSGFLIVVTAALAEAVVSRHRAGAAADLAALAAASGDGPTDTCERAKRVAEANAGRLAQCRTLGDGSVLVRVGVALPGGLNRVAGPAWGQARAGPAPAGPAGRG